MAPVCKSMAFIIKTPVASSNIVQYIVKKITMIHWTILTHCLQESKFLMRGKRKKESIHNS